MVIVIVPMVAVAVVLFELMADSERGKSDARLAQAQRAAEALYRNSVDRGGQAGQAMAASDRLAAAIAGGSPSAIESELERLRLRTRSERVQLDLAAGPRVAVGETNVIAPAGTDLVGAGGEPAGELTVSVMTAPQFVRTVASYTGLEVVVGDKTGTVASTLRGADVGDLPERGEASFDGTDYRTTSFSAPAFAPGERLTVTLLTDEGDIRSSITEDSVLIAGLLLGFLVLASLFAFTVSRSLQSQVGRLLEAARRLGGGEFSVQVPTEGNDEFAELGSEFNAMARQLEARLADLQTERTRLQHAIRRVGESFAKGLDRDAVLDIVVQTAVDGIGAEAGRVTVREFDGGPFSERARAGDVASHRRALHAAESAVLEAREPAVMAVGAAYTLAHPLKATEDDSKVLGIVSIARVDRPYSEGERSMLNYLASQAAVSIENVDLHESVQRQAVTDELTGLFNHRRFQEAMGIEVQRAKRFSLSLGLVMFDLDDFKSINDTHGHLQGDIVLREVARVVRDTCREIDEPARYGGEEIAIALPETDLEGAAHFGERLRQRIQALDITPSDPDRGPLKVTASFGVAAMPESAEADKDALVAAADAALYRAKRLGKNRVVKAG